eukprot:COSAG05_NODE_2107_length_3551_cov_3.251738_2_plen_165_part_00
MLDQQTREPESTIAIDDGSNSISNSGNRNNKNESSGDDNTHHWVQAVRIGNTSAPQLMMPLATTTTTTTDTTEEWPIALNSSRAIVSPPIDADPDYDLLPNQQSVPKPSCFVETQSLAHDNNATPPPTGVSFSRADLHNDQEYRVLRAYLAQADLSKLAAVPSL